MIWIWATIGLGSLFVVISSLMVVKEWTAFTRRRDR